MFIDSGELTKIPRRLQERNESNVIPVNWSSAPANGDGRDWAWRSINISPLTGSGNLTHSIYQRFFMTFV